MPDLADGPLLSVRHLFKTFTTKRRGQPPQVTHAVDDVSFDLAPGQTLGIVGESGSGKTTVVRCVLRALRPTSGRAIFQTEAGLVDLAGLKRASLKPLRRQMQMIFQDPYSSLNPRMTVGQIVEEPLAIHRIGDRRDRRRRVAELLERVGMPGDAADRFPNAFSGGQRQRIGIARTLILHPRLVVADESVSALDITIQKQVLDLLQSLQQELQLTYIFVSHDLRVVRTFCDDVAVMHRGRIVERGPAEQVFRNPQEPYTQTLCRAIPSLDPDRRLPTAASAPAQEA